MDYTAGLCPLFLLRNCFAFIQIYFPLLKHAFVHRGLDVAYILHLCKRAKETGKVWQSVRWWGCQIVDGKVQNVKDGDMV